MEKHTANTDDSEEKISGKNFEILLVAFHEFKKDQKKYFRFRNIHQKQHRRC